MKHLIVTVYDKKLNMRAMKAAEGENLMQLFGRHQIFFDANCGGAGRCRQCEVLVDGLKRRACRYVITHDCKVVLPIAFEPSVSVVLTDAVKMPAEPGECQGQCVCVDLGTTTIAMALCNSNHEVMREVGMENSQRAYGADVASRIRMASTPDGLQTLRKLVLSDLKRGLDELSVRDGGMALYVTGNTVMLHILAGHSPESIGSYPFTPKHPEYQQIKLPDIGTLHLLPCASGYVGSDVTIGAFYYRLHHKEQPCLLLDMGTNGEMILGDRTHMISTSVAVGPAFESMTRHAESLFTLKNLLLSGDMNRHGTLSDVYSKNGVTVVAKEQTDALNAVPATITITQDDIRAFQLAKSAVRAGIELLAQRFGCALDEIQTVYLAGGFGFHLDVECAFFLNLLPEEFCGKLEVVGNSSLKGNIACHEHLEELEQLNESILHIDLSLLPEFQERYIHYIDF